MLPLRVRTLDLVGSSLLLALSALFFAGCGATAPVINSISTPDTLETGQPGTFRAKIENPNQADEPLTYTWTYGDGSTGSGLRARHSYGSTGRYTVRFRASNEGGADSARATVQVVRPPQPARITSLNASPNPVDAGNRVRFTSNVQGDSPIAHKWSFGDGTSGSGASATHTYESAGQYTARLRVSNSAGKDTRTVSVRVNRTLPSICRTVSDFNSVFFDSNSSTLNAEARKSLRENSTILSKCPNVSVRIEGFAAPGERNAQSLSEDRAQAVAKFYRSAGVSSGRITTRGRGQVSGVTSKKGGTREYRRADSIPRRQGGNR